MFCCLQNNTRIIKAYERIETRTKRRNNEHINLFLCCSFQITHLQEEAKEDKLRKNYASHHNFMLLSSLVLWIEEEDIRISKLKNGQR